MRICGRFGAGHTTCGARPSRAWAAPGGVSTAARFWWVNERAKELTEPRDASRREPSEAAAWLGHELRAQTPQGAMEPYQLAIQLVVAVVALHTVVETPWI